MAAAEYPKSEHSKERSDLPKIARANALAAQIESEAIQRSDVVRILLELASASDALVAESVKRDINSDGFIANVEEDVSRLQSELAAARRHYCDVARRLLDKLPTETLVRLVTELVAKSTDGGRKRASPLIEDIVNDYEIAAQSFIDGESSNVRKLLALIRLRVARGDSARVDGLVERLREVLSNWTFVSRPIQMISCARGFDHLASRALARDVTGLAVELGKANDHSNAMVGIIDGLAREFALLPEFSADLARAHASVAASWKGQDEFRLDKGESEPSLSYSADVGVIFRRRLEISATELVWKGCVYRFEEMVHLRWGQRSMFGLWIGAPYVILVKTPSRCAIIKLKSAETFGAVVDRLWQSVGVRLLYEYVEQLKKGGRIAFPGVIIEDDAVTFVPRKLFGAREEATLSWDEVRALSTDHCLIIRSKGDNERRAVLSYVKTDNIRVIEHMIGLLLASGKPSISAVLG